jgi:hypothetical protein
MSGENIKFVSSSLLLPFSPETDAIDPNVQLPPSRRHPVASRPPKDCSQVHARRRVGRVACFDKGGWSWVEFGLSPPSVASSLDLHTDKLSSLADCRRPRLPDGHLVRPLLPLFSSVLCSLALPSFFAGGTPPLSSKLSTVSIVSVKLVTFVFPSPLLFLLTKPPLPHRSTSPASSSPPRSTTR